MNDKISTDDLHEAVEAESGLGLQCSCGGWAMLYRNSFGADAATEHAKHAASHRDDGRSTPERRDERAKWTKDIAAVFRGLTKDPHYAAYCIAADFLDPIPSESRSNP
jgi:hypothetical protein